MNNNSNPHTTGRLSVDKRALRCIENRAAKRHDQHERIRTRMAGAMLELAEKGADITRDTLAERYGFSTADLERHGRQAAALASRAKPDLTNFLHEMGA